MLAVEIFELIEGIGKVSGADNAVVWSGKTDRRTIVLDTQLKRRCCPCMTSFDAASNARMT